jgi:hypothetical protein
MNNRAIRAIVRGAYDLQKLRIQTGLRIVANFKVKLGQSPGERETELSTEAKVLLRDLRADYRRLTDGLKGLPKRADFKPDELISEYAELALVAQYDDLDKAEAKLFGMVEQELQKWPIYTEFLEPIRGIGPAMAGVIISEIDITRATYPSTIFRLAGLDVVKFDDENGGIRTEGRGRKEGHLVKRQYINKKGEQAERDSITFNPFLKTKLVGVLATSFLRAGENRYAEEYRNYKHRLQTTPAHSDKSKLHIHNMALRYMIKRFLIDLYHTWRRLEGLEDHPEYGEAKQGIKHKKASGD